MGGSGGANASQQQLSKGRTATEASQASQSKPISTNKDVVSVYIGKQEVSDHTGSTSRAPTGTEVLCSKGGILSQFSALYEPETGLMRHFTMLRFPPTDFSWEELRLYCTDTKGWAEQYATWTAQRCGPQAKKALLCLYMDKERVKNAA